MPSTPDTHLLATKLHAPHRRRRAVPRARLTDRLANAHHPALTLVSAPAGFGKTTLLTEWFDAAQVPGTSSAAWLALDAGDNDPVLFGSYLLAALRSAVPDVGAAATDALQSGQSLASVVAELVNDLQTLTGELTVVLDDYHTIETGEIHEALAFLVNHAPPRFHLVVATRADPPLPLARWRAGGELLEIRAADLRFTTAEAASYFHDAMDLQLTAADVGALEARTEGWIAALQLAALSLQGRDDVAGFIDNFTGDDRFVLDYLAEEVLDRQPEHLRRFLLQTSVLDRLSGPLCDAVTETSGGKATLELLDRANLFLVALDDRRHWYRYHHLFADVVRARLLDEDPALVGELHRRACEWYDQNGEPAEAIRHAMAGNHLDRAARLVELAAPAMQRARQETTLRRWLEALPDELYDDRPVLAMVLLGARMATGEMTGVEQLLDRVERWLTPLDGRDSTGTADTRERPIVHDPEQFAQLAALVEVHRAGLALVAGDTAGTIEHATRVLALVEPTDRFRIGAANALIGLAHWSLGDLEEARRRYAASVECFTEAGFISDVLGCSLGLADQLVALGRLHDAQRVFESALQLAERHGVLRGTADMHVGLAELFLEWADLDSARHHLQAAEALGEAAGLPQLPYRWRAATAHFRQAEGDAAGALSLLEEAGRRYNTDFSPSVRPMVAVVARARLAGGDVAAAGRWATDSGVTADDELCYLREYEHITLARIMLARTAASGRTRDTLALLERLLAAAEQGGRDGVVVELLALSALAQEARGDRPAATAAIERALVRGAPEGYVRTFLEAGSGIVTLLRAVTLPTDAARHAQRVLAAAGPVDAAPPPAHGRLVEPLSDRELDVLRLLRSELSGPAIARELHVSLNTLRTHTKNIYTKLGATSRREAVRLAAEHAL